MKVKREITTTFFYYMRYVALYGVLGVFGIAAPQILKGTSIGILAGHIGAFWAYGGALCVASLFLLAGGAVMSHSGEIAYLVRRTPCTNL